VKYQPWRKQQCGGVAWAAAGIGESENGVSVNGGVSVESKLFFMQQYEEINVKGRRETQCEDLSKAASAKIIERNNVS